MYTKTEFEIKTEFVYPPIPIRFMDWRAWQDGREEYGPYGTGTTEQEAIDDLLSQLDES